MTELSLSLLALATTLSLAGLVWELNNVTTQLRRIADRLTDRRS